MGTRESGRAKSKYISILNISSMNHIIKKQESDWEDLVKMIFSCQALFLAGIRRKK